MLNRISIVLFCALVAGIFFGEIGAMMMPFQIGALIDGLQLSESRAGFVGSAETVTIGIVMLAISFGAVRAPPRTMVMYGAAIAAIGQLLTAVVDMYGVIIAARIVVGLGSALCQSAAVITIASLRDPDSVTGHVYAYVILILAVLVFSVPWLLPYGHHRALFTLFAVLTASAIPLLARLPNQRSEQPIREASDASGKFWQLVVLFFIAETFLLAGFGSVWAFIERIGLNVGLSPNDVGLYLGLGMLVSMAGSFLAGYLGVRHGRKLPLVVGALVSAISCGLVPLSTTSVAYILLMFFFQFMLSFVLPYLVGTSAVIDRTGRMATAAFAVQILSYGIGSAAAGLAVEVFSLTSLAVIGFGGPAVAAFFFWLLCNRMPRSAIVGTASM